MTHDAELDPRAATVMQRIATGTSPIDPPPGLAERTISYVFAADAVPSSLINSRADQPVILGRRRADLIVAAAIGFVVFALGVSGVQKLRADSSRASCQNTLRDLHVSLTEYADSHHGRYPSGSQAGDFVDELSRSGFAPKTLTCAADPAMLPVSYTYTLGFRSNGGVVGFRRPDPLLGNEDGMPLVADFPTAKVAPTSGLFSPHGAGQNVLFAGGYVRYTTSALVGLDGDDIYRNRDGMVGAGLTSLDACLGRPTDRP